MPRAALRLISLLLLAAPVHAQSINDTIRDVRAKYPATVNGEQMGAMLNEIAWLHRAEGWGLLSKTSGNHCPQPTTGAGVSCDWLMKGERGWDAFSGAESSGDSFLVLGVQGEGTPNGPFVAPVDPGTPSEPNHPTDPSGDHDAILDLLGDFQSQANVKLDTILAQGEAIAAKLDAQPPTPTPPSNLPLWLRGLAWFVTTPLGASLLASLGTLAGLSVGEK